MAQAASDRGVQGTPTFFVNGNKVDAYDWATLEPFLKEAGS
jgi:protein-disulfide isomerase